MFQFLFFGDDPGGGGVVSTFDDPQETLSRVVLDVPSISAADLDYFMRTGQNVNLSVRAVADFVRGLAGGARQGAMELAKGAARARARLIIEGSGPANGEAFQLCGVTFTARTSGAVGNEFNVSATPTIVAENIIAAVNGSASARVTGAVIAIAQDGIVTFAARVPGAEGNGFVLSGSLSNTSVVDFSGGSNGKHASYIIN